MMFIILTFLLTSLLASGQYYLTDDVAIWINETQETKEFDVSGRTFCTGLDIDIITHREHLERLIANWSSPFNVGDLALLSKHYRHRPSLEFVANVISTHWM